jgi:hypothetical protein
MSNTITPGVTSTNYDASYSRNNVVTAKLVNIGNTQEYVTEFFSMNLIRLLRAMKLSSVGQIGTVPLTTQSFKLYNNTTAWWMIGLLNGFGNYMVVPSYEVIGYPDITVLNNLTNISTGVNVNQSNVTI